MSFMPALVRLRGIFYGVGGGEARGNRAGKASRQHGNATRNPGSRAKMTILSQARRRVLLSTAFAGLFTIALPASAQQSGQRVTITGEISDSWCTISGLMFAKGTAHHQCAVWCALGGIPVAIRDAGGNLYLILKIGDDEDSAGNPRVAKLATHEVTVDGELLERDGVKYLLVDRIADDKGVITMTQEEHGIQPFGN
ncbi:hypothetical protein ACWIGM_12830 [Bosea sp. NPDC055332]